MRLQFTRVPSCYVHKPSVDKDWLIEMFFSNQEWNPKGGREGAHFTSGEGWGSFLTVGEVVFKQHWSQQEVGLVEELFCKALL